MGLSGPLIVYPFLRYEIDLTKGLEVIPILKQPSLTKVGQLVFGRKQDFATRQFPIELCPEAMVFKPAMLYMGPLKTCSAKGISMLLQAKDVFPHLPGEGG